METDPKCVWVKSVPLNWSEKELHANFDRFGTIEKIDLPGSRQGVRRPYGFIHFSRPEEAAAALAANDILKQEGKNLELHPGTVQRTTGPSRSRPPHPPRDFPPPPIQMPLPIQMPPPLLYRDPYGPRYEDEYRAYGYPPRRDLYDDRYYGYLRAPYYEDAQRYNDDRRPPPPRDLVRYPDEWQPRDEYFPPRVELLPTRYDRDPSPRFGDRPQFPPDDYLPRR
jgi:RNA recognition motif-containing protein